MLTQIKSDKLLLSFDMSINYNKLSIILLYKYDFNYIFHALVFQETEQLLFISHVIEI